MALTVEESLFGSRTPVVSARVGTRTLKVSSFKFRHTTAKVRARNTALRTCAGIVYLRLRGNNLHGNYWDTFGHGYHKLFTTDSDVLLLLLLRLLRSAEHTRIFSDDPPPNLNIHIS